MAATWHVYNPGLTFNTSKSLVDLSSTDATKVIRVYRIWLFNSQTSAVTGVVLQLLLSRLTAGSSGGSALTPVAKDTSSAALAAGTTCGTGRTVTRGSGYRRFAYSSDEPGVGSGTWDELECIVPLSVVWDSGYGDSNVEPIVVRQNQGFDLQQITTSTVGVADLDFEFTNT